MNTICMITIQHLMSEHFSDSISNRSARPEKNILQKKHITRLEGYNNTDQLCVRESLPTNLSGSWSYKELLHNIYGLINHGNQIIPVTHKEVYLLSRPSKAMAQWKIHYMPKEDYILSGPSKLQPVADYTIATHCTHKEFCFLPEPSKKKMDPYSLTKQTLVQHRQNTSWEPATVVSQSSSNSYWIIQENCTDQPRVYRRTRSMLKIRCTDIQQTRHNYSQSTETEKAKFQTPSTYNDERNFLKCNSVKKLSDDLVHPTNKILPLLLLLYFQKKGRKLQQMFLHLHPHWRQSRNSLTLQDQESQRERTLEGQPVHLVTFTCKWSKTLSQPGSVDNQYKVELSNVYKSRIS